MTKTAISSRALRNDEAIDTLNSDRNLSLSVTDDQILNTGAGSNPYEYIAVEESRNLNSQHRAEDLFTYATSKLPINSFNCALFGGVGLYGLGSAAVSSVISNIESAFSPGSSLCIGLCALAVSIFNLTAIISSWKMHRPG